MPLKDKLEHSHHPADIANRIDQGPPASYLRDWIYGGIDGAVTTFAIVAGSVGANLSARIVLILGLANLLADGFSMAAANYSGSKSEVEEYERLLSVEEKHIRHDPEGEREEIRQIYSAKGFAGEDLEHLVRILTSREQVWIDSMMLGEYGLSGESRSPMKAAIATFLAFILCGSVPLFPFVFGLPASATVTAASTALAFFAIGSVRARWSMRHWLTCGLETMAIGMSAAGIAYLVGHLLHNWLT